ncbi:MAG: hydrogenase maturation protease [Nitrospirota bacterium]
MPEKTENILILGVGNPLYTDDGLGNKIIEIINERYRFPETVRLIDSGSITDLIDFIFDYRYIIVIDTIIAGKKSGEIMSFSLNEMSAPSNSLTHSTGLIEGLQKMKERPDIFFICIEPCDLSPGTALSDKVSEKISDIINMIIDRLNLHGLKMQRK